MWLALILLAAAGVAFIGTLVGIGWLAIPIAVLAAGAALWLVARGAKETSGGASLTREDTIEAEGQAPQDARHRGRYVVKGPAHPGQEHMTGEQIEHDTSRH